MGRKRLHSRILRIDAFFLKGKVRFQFSIAKTRFPSLYFFSSFVFSPSLFFRGTKGGFCVDSIQKQHLRSREKEKSHTNPKQPPSDRQIWSEGKGHTRSKKGGGDQRRREEDPFFPLFLPFPRLPADARGDEKYIKKGVSDDARFPAQNSGA